MMKDKVLLISFSGGRTSAFMCKWILEADKYKDYQKVFVFANTGKEREETLDFVDKCDKEWSLNVVWVEAKVIHKFGVGIKHKVVNFDNASRNGEPFEEVIKKMKAFPNQNAPFCSERLKALPIKHYMKSLGIKKYYTAVGIRADEVQRINWENAKKTKYIYPLVTDFRVNERFIREFWDKQCFDLQLKDYEGNCDNCYKKSLRKLLTLASENPKSFDWWAKMEDKYGDIKPETNEVWYRKELSAKDIVAMSEKNKFNKALDVFEVSKTQFNMFDLDAEKSCFCK